MLGHKVVCKFACNNRSTEISDKFRFETLSLEKVVNFFEQEINLFNGETVLNGYFDGNFFDLESGLGWHERCFGWSDLVNVYVVLLDHLLNWTQQKVFHEWLHILLPVCFGRRKRDESFEISLVDLVSSLQNC